MSKQSILLLASNLSELIANELGFELVDLEYVKENGNYFLRVFIDKSGGITLDDCQKFSEKLASKLDANDPIKGSYYLEVSSPGLDRPIKTDRDLERNLGREVEVKLYRHIDKKKLHIGELRDFDKEEVTIVSVQGSEIKIPRDCIALMNLSIKI